uniref:TIGR03759 family integrating conjugative element protein n=1 Tax=Pseudomonas huaxiensis TaxID=2213017 RepID=UPI000DA6765B
MPRIVLFAALLVIQQTASASDMTERKSGVQISRALSLSEKQLAEAWGLQPEELSRYRALMQGPLGVYSPNIDPLTALGIEAESEADQRRYADLQVQAEAHRVEKLLAYQRAYDRAWQARFPGMLRAELPDNTPISSPRPNRLALFVQADCPPCEHKVIRLQLSSTPFDLYLVGSGNDDQRIRGWARKVGIDPAQVQARRITLNHDAGRWESLGLAGQLPALVREVDGQWIRQ